MQGSSLLSSAERSHFLYEHLFSHPGISIARSEGIRTKRLKYLHFIDHSLENEMLFDLVEDPYELNNLAEENEYKSDLSELRSLLAKSLELAA